MLRCAGDPECGNACANHRWGKTRAAQQGWFFSKDGKAWCPLHLPEWYTAWKASK